jgi:hypothetical protein
MRKNYLFYAPGKKKLGGILKMRRTVISPSFISVALFLNTCVPCSLKPKK